MKKVISVILSVILIGSCFSLMASAVPSIDLGFAVASDLHVNVPAAELERTNDDELFWYANRRAAMDNESGYILDSFLNQCAEDDSVKFVLISGDIADHGRTIPAEHELAAAKFREFEQKSGKEVYVINGNHDCGNNSSTTIDNFKRIYADFGYDHALATREGDGSYTADLGTKYRLIAFDSCDQNGSTADGVTSDRIKWVHEQANLAKKDGRYPILMMHHNLLDHMPLQPVFSKNFIVGNHLAVAEQFADWGINLVFTGHEHCSDAASYTSALGNVITDFATTALSMYPLAYRVFTLSEYEMSYDTKEVKSIDTADLSSKVSGYTPAMLEAMNTDLNKFAKGFLKAGIQYRLELSLSEEKLGIDENAVYYDLVMDAVTKLKDMLNMPLYGEGSVQELGIKYNVEIPDSEYKTGWDLATELVAAHYAGCESYLLDGTEITLLLRTAALILREESLTVGDDLYINVANALFASLGTADSSEALASLGSSVYGGVTPGEYLIIAIASPLLYGFANDDNVNDNCGTLEGYGSVGFESNVSNIGANLLNIFNKFEISIKAILRYIGFAIK